MSWNKPDISDLLTVEKKPSVEKVNVNAGASSWNKPDISDIVKKQEDVRPKFGIPPFTGLEIDDLGYKPNAVGVESDLAVIGNNGFIMFKNTYEEIEDKLKTLQKEDPIGYSSLLQQFKLRKNIEKNRKGLIMSFMTPGRGQFDYYKLNHTPESQALVDLWDIDVEVKDYQSEDSGYDKFFPYRTKPDGSPLGEFGEFRFSRERNKLPRIAPRPGLSYPGER